jgi:hypothetical protein
MRPRNERTLGKETLDERPRNERTLEKDLGWDFISG